MKSTPMDISVLYVDDDLQSCAIMASLMRFYVREVHLAHDGFEGIEMYRSHQPDVVMTDFSMPVMDGGEMVRGIRAERPDITVIFMTAHDNVWLAEQLEDNKKNRYLIKPVDFSSLLVMLREICSCLK